MLKIVPLLLLIALVDATFINSSQQLEWQLQKLSNAGINNVHLILDSMVPYRLTGDSFSYFINKNIIMESRNNDQTAKITCICDDVKLSTRGIVFINSSVTIIGISFKNCGTHFVSLLNDITDQFNITSPLYYSTTNAAVLLFIHCIVTMDTVVIESSVGFALVGYNLRSSQFHSVTVCNSTQQSDNQESGPGSGMLLHFSDTELNETTEILLNNMVFKNNKEHSNKVTYCTPDIYYYTNKGRYPVENAAGLTILYTQNSYRVNTVIRNGRFNNNSGTLAGGCLILHYETNITSTTIVDSSIFQNNAYMYHSRATCDGVGLQFYWIGGLINITKPLIVQNTQFNGGSLQVPHNSKQSGAVSIGICSLITNIYITFENVTFFDNHAPGLGGIGLTGNLCEHFIGETIVTITMDSITAIKNTNYNKKSATHSTTPTSVFFFKSIKNVVFTGKGVFTDNYGSVIKVQQSNVFLQGNISFLNNIGEKGGAVRIEGDSYLYLMNGLTAIFSNNEAVISGGAIYAVITSYINCAIQINDITTVKISFMKNTASMAGYAIFANPVYECHLINGTYQKNWVHVYEKYFKLTNDSSNSLLQISTAPRKIYVIFYRNKRGLHNKIPKLFPGEKLDSKVVTVDQVNRRVFSFFDIDIHNDYIKNNTLLKAKSTGGNKVPEGTYNTNINITVDVDGKLDTPLNAKLVFSAQNTFSRTYNIKLLPCPLGFTLLSSGSCDCSPVFNKTEGIRCSIDERTIFLPSQTNTDGIWIGLMNKTIGLSRTCPETYCKKPPTVKITDNAVYLTKENNYPIADLRFCQGNRIGPLCGECMGNYSAVFGSSECKLCSNFWLFTIIGYAIIGPVLIYIMFALQLTLTTGTINAIIFYAQVASAGLLQFMSQSSSKLDLICTSILSFLNLSLGFPLCFYNGMNHLWKTGLSLTFPIYLLIIVAVIIIISRYSTWLSNRTAHLSIQVLVTVVHISFSTLLVTLIDVFTKATIYTTNGTHHVWYWDGSVAFMGGSHYPLVIVTVITVTLLIVPYVILLIIGRPLIKCSKMGNFYMRPIYEAIHAPYKAGSEYWFTARLILLIIIYIIYITLRTTNSILLGFVISLLLCSFMVVQAVSRPFKNNFINALDCWIMFNITIVYNILWSEMAKVLNVFNMIAVGSTILTFVAILIYHILLVTNRIPKISNIITAIEQCYSKHFTFRQNNNQSRVQLVNTNSYGSCEGYREPLISDK